MMLLAASVLSFAGDNAKGGSFNSIRLLKSNNFWLNTGNVAGLVFNQPGNIANFELGQDYGDGDFHRIREAGNYNNYSVATESYQVLKNRMFLYGKFAYHYLDEKGAQWSGTYNPYSGNPYLLADSVSGTTFHKENYNLAGGAGYRLNDKMVLGCGLDYYVGVGAKQKDPRPEITFVQFQINPSLIFTASNYKLGFDLGYKNKKEEIKYDTKRSNFSPAYFTFKGFGFYSKEIADGYKRFSHGDELFAGIQFEKKLKGIPTLTELRFNYDLEEIEDGESSYRREDGGEWENYRAELTEQVNISSGATQHHFKAMFSFFNGDGKEFTQNKVYEGPWRHLRYVTIAKNLKFNRQTINGTFSYNYQRLNEEKRADWDVFSSVNFISNDEKYYYIPEIFTSSYSNVTANLSVQKNFYSGSIHVSPALNASYTSNLSNSMQLSSLDEITKKQRKDVYLQEFDYYVSDLIRLGGELKAGISSGKLKNIGQIYLSLRYDYCKQINGSQNFTMINTKLGFVF